MNNKAYIAIIVLLAIACGWLGYTVMNKEEVIQEKIVQVDEGELERDRLELDLMKMRHSYDTLYTENSALTAEMDAQRAQVDDLLQKVKDRNWSLGKLKKEAGTLREIMKGYVVTIDSLNTMNQELLAENQDMRTRVQNVQDENSQLKEKQGNMEKIISTGQSLQATGIVTQGVRVRNTGKQQEIARASKVEIIKTCFNVLKNSIAPSGEKVLYAQVISPEGKVLWGSDGDASVNLAGKNDNYSVKRTIDYQNEEMTVCLFYEMQAEAVKGDYTVMLYENETLMGSSTLTLR